MGETLQTRLRILLSIVFVFVAATAARALTAGFSASPTSGCAPLLVNFTNSTTPSTGTSYSWTFGSSGTSVLTNPSTSFTSPGTYVVTLTATNGGQTSTYSMTITVYPPPTVSFTASDTTVCPGTPITFTNGTTGGVPGPVSYTWGFGDGTPTTSTVSPVHTYTASGDYTVTLLATNSSGCSSTLVKTNYIHVFPDPVGSFTWTPTGVCNPPGGITFTNTSTGTPPSISGWSFGDGGSGAGSPVTHTYTAVGTYNVTLYTTDANGCADTVTLGPINVDTAHANFTLPSATCLYANVNFTNTSTPHVAGTWDYGDGSPTTFGMDGSHIYTAPGTYSVTLTISNPPCTVTITHTIVVSPTPTINFNISPPLPCPLPQTLTYTGTGSAGTTYNWTFAGVDPGTATGSPATHIFNTYGVYTVTMVATDPTTGCRDTVSKTDTLYDLHPLLTATPSSGCLPLTVIFNFSIYTTIPSGSLTPYPATLSGYTWNYGDGSGTSASASGLTTHTYTATGVYVATVTATTSNGCPVTDTISIRVGSPTAATFSASPIHICYGSHTPVVFTPTVSIGPVDMYHWDFGDGTLDEPDTNAHSVSHVYTVPGTFTVTVTPYYNGCPGTPWTSPVTIIVDSSKSIIKDSVYCSPPNRVKFTDASLGDDSHMWILSDGYTSTASSFTHDFPGTGTYSIKLATYNAASGCRDTAIKIIGLFAPVLNFAADDTVLCKDETANFTSIFVGGTAINYWWYVNGVMDAWASSSFSWTFPSTGYSSIMLVVLTDNGCYDTLTRPNYIYVSHPSPGFAAPTVSGCSPMSVTFTDATTATPGSTPLTYSWGFGDATTGVGSPVTHTYTAAGTYDIKEVVTDAKGCKDSLTQTGYINVYHPTASFVGSTTHPCVNIPMTFTSTSTGSIATATWNFGDGSSPGSGTTVTHSYSATGTYNVTLDVTDTHGCTNTISVPGYIVVTQPTAGFTESDSVSVCPPLTVNFTNTSVGAVGYNWDFGDGSNSVVVSPTDIYITPGLYNVTMVASNEFGCKDTARHTVRILGYAGAFSYSPLSGCVPLTVHFVATLTNVPTITWDFSDGYTAGAAFSDTISHTYLTPGAYVPKLLLADNTGCQNSSLGVDTIKVDGVTAKFGTTTTCIGIPFSLVDSSSSYWSTITTLQWTFNGVSTTTPSPSYTVDTPGIFPVTLHVVDGWGCIGDAIGNVIIYPPPVVSGGRDTVVCVGDPATLLGSGAYTYEWSPAGTLSCSACNPTNATPSVQTTYTVIGTDVYGCKDTASVTVGLRTLTVSNAWGDTAVCPGYSVQLHDTGGTTYLWLANNYLNNNTIANPISSTPVTITYMAIAKLASCIPDTDYVNITIYPQPSINAGADQRLVAGATAQLQATSTYVVKYAWTPSNTLSCDDCVNPVASMTVTTIYTVVGTSIHGCIATDSVRILLYCDNSQMFIPNSFTPNGDGENDVFYPRGVGIKSVKSFRIYNRWGELLFERNGIDLNDKSNAWDGSYKGQAAHPDVYVYVVEAQCYTGDDIFIKGDVTIIR